MKKKTEKHNRTKMAKNTNEHFYRCNRTDNKHMRNAN